MRINKNYKSIAIHGRLHEDLMLFKIKSKAKSLEEVIGKALKILKIYLKDDNDRP